MARRFGTRKDGRAYPKRDRYGFDPAKHITGRADLESIAGAPEAAGSALHRHSPPFLESDQARRRDGGHCAKCKKWTGYSVNGIPVCETCWEAM